MVAADLNSGSPPQIALMSRDIEDTTENRCAHSSIQGALIH